MKHKDIRAKVEKYRKDNGITVTHLSTKVLNISRVWYYKFLNGGNLKDEKIKIINQLINK